MENLCNIFNIYMATTLAHKSSAGDGSEATHTHTTRTLTTQPRKEACEKKIPVNNKFLDNNNNNKREAAAAAAAAAKSAEL